MVGKFHQRAYGDARARAELGTSRVRFQCNSKQIEMKLVEVFQKLTLFYFECGFVETVSMIHGLRRYLWLIKS